jgi:predicted nucleic acid-binding protein
MSVRYVVDSNVLLRFLTGQPTEMAEHARVAIEKAAKGDMTLEVYPMTVAEVVYSLEGKVYQVDRKAVVDRLLKLLDSPGFRVHEKGVVFEALRRHQAFNVSFPDCYFAACAKESKMTVLSFDSDFDKFQEGCRTRPESV